MPIFIFISNFSGYARVFKTKYKLSALRTNIRWTKISTKGYAVKSIYYINIKFVKFLIPPLNP